MVMFDNSTRITIDRLLVDAEEDRRRGCRSSDVDVLRDRLSGALDKIHSLESDRDDELSTATDKVSDLEAEANCGISDVDRRAYKPCEGDDCTACRLVWAALEKDCGTTDYKRGLRLCGAAHLGVDRCCVCAAFMLKIETTGQIEERDAEIARLTRECDETRESSPNKAADTIAQLRTDLALTKARHDCGREDRETSDEPCPLRDTPQGCCDECFVKAALAGIGRGEAEKREALTTEIAGLKNALTIVTQERNDAVIRAGVIRAPKPERAPKAEAGPSLFDRLGPVSTAPVKAKRGRKVKKYPLVVKS